MKYYFITTVYIFSLFNTKAQSWLTTNTKFNYNVSYIIRDIDDKLLDEKKDALMTIKIDSVYKTQKFSMAFLSGFFDLGISGSFEEGFGFYGSEAKVCIAVYKNRLYRLFYDSTFRFDTKFDFADLLHHKYKNIDYEYMLNLAPNKNDPSEYKSSRFENSYKPNVYEKGFVFVRSFNSQKEFKGLTNLYKEMDDKGYINDSLSYSPEYFITSYVRKNDRSPNPYEIRLKLIKVEHQLS